LIGLTVFLFVNVALTGAANRIKVATLGTHGPAFDKTKEMQQAVVQMTGFWQQEISQVLSCRPDLIVLPESCDLPAGLTREERDEYLRIRGDQTLNLFSSIAKENHCYIAFGMYRPAEDGKWYNSAVLLDRKGGVAGIYNKNFPTIRELEEGIKAGTETPLIRCDFGTVACAICFDLNFPELMQKYEEKKPDIILFPSMYHGGLMQNCWAYFCRSFFIGSLWNKNVPSEIRNPFGNVVASSTNYSDYAVATINLDRVLVHLDYNQKKLKELKKKYGEAVTITDPGRFGSVLITSEHESISAAEMAKELDIELLDDYFDRSREVRQKSGQ